MRGEINLLPAEYKKKPVATREQIYLALLILLALFYMAYYGVGVAGVERANINDELKAVNAELATLTEAAAKYEMKLAQEQVLSTNKKLAEGLAQKVRSLSPVLLELSRLMPEKVSLSEVSTGEMGLLILKGRASKMESISDFLDALNQSQYFKNTKAMDIRENQNKSGYIFEINCTWSKGGGQE